MQQFPKTEYSLSKNSTLSKGLECSAILSQDSLQSAKWTLTPIKVFLDIICCAYPDLYDTVWNIVL